MQMSREMLVVSCFAFGGVRPSSGAATRLIKPLIILQSFAFRTSLRPRTVARRHGEKANQDITEMLIGRFHMDLIA